MKELSSENYDPLWTIEGVHYLFCSIYLESYAMDHDFVCYNENNVHTLFISKSDRKKLSEEGFNLIYKDFDVYEKRVKEKLKFYGKLFEDIKTKNVSKLSNNELAEDFEDTIKHSLEFLDLYFWTEYFCADKVAEILEKGDTGVNMKVLKKNVDEMAKLKFEERKFLNDMVYAPGILETYTNEIAKRFKIPYIINSYHYKELLGLLKGKKIERPDRSIVIFGRFSDFKDITGEKAKQIAKKLTEVNLEVTELKGNIGNKGKYTGEVKVIKFSLETDYVKEIGAMKKGQVLVSGSTGPEMILACKKAGAIVTEEGGITSHAAIVSRELGIPCIVGTKIASRVLKDGDLIEVDANKGVVKILKKND